MSNRQCELLDPQPTLDRRQRMAAAYAHRVGYWAGSRHQDPTADLLLLRMGLQQHNRRRRWGYQISNPTYHDILSRNPRLDDSLPGPAWLHQVYTTLPDRMPLTLPSTRQAMHQRHAAVRAGACFTPAAAPAPQAPSTPQLDLFAA